jgi:glycosyltransferase involved in cell wall biosynthesis
MVFSPLRVAVVSISLARGGAERSTAILTKMLDSLGVEVHLITITDDVVYEYSGKLFNLGAYKSKNDTLWARWKQLKLLRKYIQKNQFDLIIDNRTRSENFKEWIYLNYIYAGQRLVYVVRSFHLQNYFPSNKSLAKQMISRSAAVVGVSKAIALEISQQYNATNVRSIYNPVPEFPQQVQSMGEKYILYLGRIEENVKNFSLLLDAYAKSELGSSNIKLKIYGQGDDENWLKEKIKERGLEALVSLHPFTPQIAEVLTNAHFLALTSRYEGFPRVLLEALSVGTPVISVDCESGPNEVIDHEKNGLLVENHNTDLLAAAFNRFIFDEDLYQKCKSNAKPSVEHLSQQNIALQWKKLIEDVTK